MPAFLWRKNNVITCVSEQVCRILELRDEGREVTPPPGKTVEDMLTRGQRIIDFALIDRDNAEANDGEE